MILHTVSLVDRKVKCNPKRFVQGGINADEIVVASDEEWTLCDKILVTFYNPSTTPETRLLPGIGQNLRVPKSVLEYVDDLYLSFTGYIDGEVRMTTQLMSSPANVVESGLVAGDITIEDEDLDFIGQLIDEVKDASGLMDDVEGAIDRANEAAEKAEQASQSRAPGISTGEGAPVIGGIKGDLYIDSESGALYEYTETNQNGG